MIENIAFLREVNCNFFSAPCAFDMSSDFFLTATKANTLIQTTITGEKKSLSLVKTIKFEKKECTKLLKMISKDRILLITTNFNVFLLEVDIASFEVTGVKALPFRYAQNLNVSHLNYNHFKECSDFSLLACGRFLFSFNQKTGTFALFKVFNDQILDFCIDSAVKNQIFVLTDKKLYLVKWETVNEMTNTKVLVQVGNQNMVKISISNFQLLALSKIGSIEFIDRKTLQKTAKMELGVDNGKKINFIDIFVINGRLIAGYDSEYIYMFLENLKGVEQVINVKNISYFFTNGQMFDLNRKSENSVRLGSLVHHTYTDENKGVRFYSQGVEDRVDIAFSYLAKLFFHKKILKNYNTTIHDMLVDLHLGASVLQHKRFKEKVMTLFNMMKDFTSCIDKTTKVYQVHALKTIYDKEDSDSFFIQGDRGSMSMVLNEDSLQLAMY